MTIRTLPAAPTLDAQARNFDWTPPETVMARWNPSIQAAKNDDDTSISIYDIIGEDPFSGQGVSLKRLSAALRSIGPKDISVNINSPGGSIFEGFGIYEALRQHKGKVTVNVMALAGSAASIIAMAGDEIKIAPSAFIFVHRAWGMTIGNEEDHARAQEDLRMFDSAMADIYQARTGANAKDIRKWMNNETFIPAKAAIENGFADAILPAADVAERETKDSKATKAMRTVEHALQQQGLSRSQRRSLLGEIKGTPSAAEHAMQDAGEIVAGIDRFLNALKPA